MCSVDIDSTGNHCTRDDVRRCIQRRRRGTYPTGHETETTETRTDTEGTFTTELDGDETERFITRRDKSEVGTTEQVRRKSRELGLRVDAIGVELHETVQLLSGETTVKINDGTDGNELNRGLLLEPNGANVNVDPHTQSDKALTVTA